jgi:hypothetical protein
MHDTASQRIGTRLGVVCVDIGTTLMTCMYQDAPQSFGQTLAS